MNSDRPHRALLLAAVLLLVAACSPERDEATLFAPQDVGILVVDAVLIVGANLLGRTLAKALADGGRRVRIAGRPDVQLVKGVGIDHKAYYRRGSNFFL